MDKVPFEILAAILRVTVHSMPKNAALNLRFVCRAFDTALKPILCQTLNLEFTRLSRFSHRRPPTPEGLQTIGYHCTSLYIDLMLLRDELEVGFLKTLFRDVPSMTEFCDTLNTRYCMNPRSFTEEEYRASVTELLFYCNRVERIRLNLPFPLVGPHCTAVTSTLANTFAALNRKEDEEVEYSKLKVLVLENAADISICSLWMNPLDVVNIRKSIECLEHFVISIRRREPLLDRYPIYAISLWSLIASASLLRTLSLVGLDCDHRPPKSIKHTVSSTVDEKLKRVEISADFFSSARSIFGKTLRELFLNEVYLKVSGTEPDQTHPFKVLWVGLPNTRPREGDIWVAHVIRENLPKLRVCRASRLGYDFYGTEAGLEACQNFDLDDPCGLKRTLARRFVEVVTGYDQPKLESGEPCIMLSPQREHSQVWKEELKPVSKRMRPSEWDTIAYQSLVANPTSAWLRSIDGIFPNCNKGTLDELHAIAQTACTGMNKLTEHRNSLAGEALVVEGGDSGSDTINTPQVHQVDWNQTSLQ
ncbi:hypothetical protein SAPIO_CDS3189 [Scedosporium apiospermum]|uniref:Uncharacterized protein n=1 Tax=Pseudallescheria apiosperma TaxID=563466 RepID=A0A084GA84_PSEDA|nr:uncharacterized protein SAPIO_CDS3189 [Scedosporium apiospermum]KEZ44246.1 hypothetical protein SAPIO_CDS3189 [Scedosporium apiospermum]